MRKSEGITDQGLSCSANAELSIPTPSPWVCWAMHSLLLPQDTNGPDTSPGLLLCTSRYKLMRVSKGHGVHTGGTVIHHHEMFEDVPPEKSDKWGLDTREALACEIRTE